MNKAEHSSLRVALYARFSDAAISGGARRILTATSVCW
jgi:hypothetical protein